LAGGVVKPPPKGRKAIWRVLWGAESDESEQWFGTAAEAYVVAQRLDREGRSVTVDKVYLRPRVGAVELLNRVAFVHWSHTTDPQVWRSFAAAQRAAKCGNPACGAALAPWQWTSRKEPAVRYCRDKCARLVEREKRRATA
jgi:hypothetical protein